MLIQPVEPTQICPILTQQVGMLGKSPKPCIGIECAMFRLGAATWGYCGLAGGVGYLGNAASEADHG